MKGILFDLDGVLIDSKDVHYQAFSEALFKFTGVHLSKEDHSLRLCGLPTLQKLQILQRELGFSEATLVEISNDKQERTRVLIEGRDFYRKDIYDLIADLSARGIKLAVCSNTTRPTLDIILESLGIKKYLNLSLSSNDVLAPKPSPDIFLKAMSRMRIKADETLILEDSNPGIEAAKLSGAHILEISSPEVLCEIVTNFFRSKV